MAYVEITEEIRRKVYAADCDRLGHVPDFRSALTTETRGGRTVQVVGAPDDDSLELPRICCSRCGMVWLVMPVGSPTYADAERVLYGHLRAESPVAQQIVRNRGVRQRRAEDRERERERRRERERAAAEQAPT